MLTVPILIGVPGIPWGFEGPPGSRGWRLEVGAISNLRFGMEVCGSSKILDCVRYNRLDFQGSLNPYSHQVIVKSAL